MPDRTMPDGGFLRGYLVGLMSGMAFAGLLFMFTLP